MTQWALIHFGRCRTGSIRLAGRICLMMTLGTFSSKVVYGGVEAASAWSNVACCMFWILVIIYMQYRFNQKNRMASVIIEQLRRFGFWDSGALMGCIIDLTQENTKFASIFRTGDCRRLNTAGNRECKCPFRYPN